MISRNFSLKEMECKCGCGIRNIDGHAIDTLQNLRDTVGRPLYITSAARCVDHNLDVGGSAISFHISTVDHKSKAFDISMRGHHIDSFVKMAQKVGFTGIGIYRTFVHVDTRPGKAHWNYA
jgi:uncharacterized protein YcbK (DUF882 family)